MLKRTRLLTGFLVLCASLRALAAPAPTASLLGKTFVLKGEAFQAKLAITDDGLGKIWRPDGFSTLQWATVGDEIFATLDTPLESPYIGTNTDGNAVAGVTRLESLIFAFADTQALLATVTESYRNVFPAESGVPEALDEFVNPDLSLVDYASLKNFTASSGSLLALPLTDNQSAIIKFNAGDQATVVEDPLNKTPSTFTWSSEDALTLSWSATSSIRYRSLQDQGLASLLLAEVQEDGKESIFISSGAEVDAAVYQTPATMGGFAGRYTIPEFSGTEYVFNADGLGEIINTDANGIVTTSIISWGEESGVIFGHRWSQLVDEQPIAVSDPIIALGCEAGTFSCQLVQSRRYKVLAVSPRQILVLRVLDPKTVDGMSSWIHVFNRISR